MLKQIISLETPIFVSQIEGNTHLPFDSDCVSGLVQIQDSLFYPIEDKKTGNYLFYAFDLDSKTFSDEPILEGEVFYLQDAGYIKKLRLL